MLQRAGRLLYAGKAAQPWNIYKGRKLSIDAAGLLGYAVKRNSGEPLCANPGIDARASVLCSAGGSPVSLTGCRSRYGFQQSMNRSAAIMQLANY
jgi:hypothetical protein